MKSILKRRGFNLLSTMLLVVGMMMIVGSCAGTKRARDVSVKKGFLVDPSILKKGSKNQFLYTYVRPDVPWATYTKMMIDPVVSHMQNESKEGGVPPEDLQRLSNNFYSLLYKAFEKDYEIVTEPGPRTIRVQVALTDLQESWATADTITSVIPVGMVLSAGTEFITGKPSFVGEASIEAKVTDSRNGQLLLAGIDRRVGGDAIEASVDTWDDVNKIMEIWAKLGRFRLCELRGEKDCFYPGE